MSAHHLSKRDMLSNKRRESVLSSAGVCFAEFGYKGTTTALIAERAGVSKGLVFHFFDNKKELFNSVVDDALEQWTMLSDYRYSEANGDALEEIRNLFIASFDFAEQYPVMALFSRREEAIVDYQKEFAKRVKRWRNRVKKSLVRGIEHGVVQKDLDATRTADIIHELQQALLRSAPSKNGVSRYDRDTVSLAITILLKGIAN